jgi:hypothetical protein
LVVDSIVAKAHRPVHFVVHDRRAVTAWHAQTNRVRCTRLETLCHHVVRKVSTRAVVRCEPVRAERQPPQRLESILRAQFASECVARGEFVGGECVARGEFVGGECVARGEFVGGWAMHSKGERVRAWGHWSMPFGEREREQPNRV